VDPGERRALVIGGVIATVGLIGCLVVAVLWPDPKGLLDSNRFMACLLVLILGLALIVAAGARDALLSGSNGEVVRLTRGDGRAPVGTLMVSPVYRNAPEGEGFRTRYELAIRSPAAIEGLLLEAVAPSVLSVRFDDSSIDHQEAGADSGHAWARMTDPPPVFRLNVMTGAPEPAIRIDASAV
jgi:hypothetical protein